MLRICAVILWLGAEAEREWGSAHTYCTADVSIAEHRVLVRDVATILLTDICLWSRGKYRIRIYPRT